MTILHHASTTPKGINHKPNKPIVKALHLITATAAAALSLVAAARGPVIAPSTAWRVTQPLGLRITDTIDTLHTNYAQEQVPSAVSAAYATTGNYGAEGRNLIFFERKPYSEFFFDDAIEHWIPTFDKMRYYNTRIPMTLLSYTTGCSKETTQDRLKGNFSGNVNERVQIGALLDYLYSKGSYNYQAAKDFAWGFSGSYTGDRFEFQGFYNHFNLVNKENGGITDERYITDPAEVQGGTTSINTKTIPTHLTAAHSRVKGGRLWLNSRYKLGFHTDVYDEETDTLTGRIFTPVTAFTWTLQYDNNSHEFINTDVKQGLEFWEHTYLDPNGTHDLTRSSSLRNTLAVTLMEGFNKWARASLSGYVTHELQSLTQTPDTLDNLPGTVDPLPATGAPAPKSTHNNVWVGGQLCKQQGQVLNYNITGEVGLIGRAAGEVKLDGRVDTHMRLLGDTVTVTADGFFHNTTPPLLLTQYLSNHFVWNNDFSKTRRYRARGAITVPRTGTRVEAGVENVQNLIYFGPDCLPRQHSGNVQVVSATLHQNLAVRALHWDNRVTWQSTSDATVLPLPALAVYSNLYVKVKVATLYLQLGVDCDYYTSYRTLAYQPATMSFYNQDEVKCGNYPFMNFYINMKLSKTRFYVMMSHINQGLTGSNYFSMPGYPLNPRRFQMGLSVEFAN